MIKPKWVKRLHGRLGIFKEGLNENRKAMVQGSKPLHANLPSPLPSTPSAHGQFPGWVFSITGAHVCKSYQVVCYNEYDMRLGAFLGCT